MVHSPWLPSLLGSHCTKKCQLISGNVSNGPFAPAHALKVSLLGAFVANCNVYRALCPAMGTGTFHVLGTLSSHALLWSDLCLMHFCGLTCVSCTFVVSLVSHALLWSPFQGLLWWLTSAPFSFDDADHGVLVEATHSVLMLLYCLALSNSIDSSVEV